MSLSGIQESSAVSYNGRNMKKIGWASHYAKVVNLVAPGGAATPQSFAQALANWQGNQRGLTSDGKLGGATWGKMKPMLATVAPVGAVPPWVTQPSERPEQSEVIPLGPLPNGAGEPAWIGVARGEMLHWDHARSEMTARQRGVTEQHTTMDETYFGAAPRWGNVTHEIGEGPGRQNRDWCAAFVNYCLHRAGFSHTGSAGAGSFAKRHLWSFEALEEPRVGCVIVLGESPGSHVGFLAHTWGLPTNPRGDVTTRELRGAGVRLLGGNQSKRVKETTYRRSLLSARGANGVVSPYFWPLQGGANCNLAFPTARPHGCNYTHDA